LFLSRILVRRPRRDANDLLRPVPVVALGLHHRLISVAPPGREITSLSLPEVSFGAALVVSPQVERQPDKNPLWVSPDQCLSGGNYQSGAEPPHSKGFASSSLLDLYQVKDDKDVFAKVR